PSSSSNPTSFDGSRGSRKTYGSPPCRSPAQRISPCARTRARPDAATSSTSGRAAIAIGENYRGAPPVGSCLNAAAPPYVATYSVGGSTIRSSFRRRTWSSGRSGPARARGTDGGLRRHPRRPDRSELGHRREHGERPIAEPAGARTLVGIAEGDRVDLAPGPVEPAGEVLRPADLPGGPAAADPEVA